MYTHNRHYFPDAPWFENYVNEDELDEMFFYDRPEKADSRYRYHSPRHFYDPNDRYFDEEAEENYHHDRLYRRASFHRDCYCNHCGREGSDYKPNNNSHKKKKNSRLNRRRSIGNLPGIISPSGGAGMNETVWNLPQNSVHSTSLHHPVRDPMTSMPSILGPALPPCATGVQSNSGWFPMTNSMAPPQPPMPNTNTFMMPNAPMMQPYFLPMPIVDFSSMTYPFPQGYTFPELKPTSAPESIPIVTAEGTVDKPVVNATNSSAAVPTHDITVKDADPTTKMSQEKYAKGHTEAMPIPLRKAPALVHRRKSLVDELVSYFSIFGPSAKSKTIYNTKWNPSSYTSLGDTLSGDTTQTLSSKSMSPPQQLQQQSEKSTSLSSASATMTAATAATNPTTAVVATTAAASGVTPITGMSTSGLSRKLSLQLSQKASILSQRPFVWCYRPFEGNANNQHQTNEEGEENKKNKSESSLWAAFDVNNQLKLDQHYQMMLSRKQSQSPSQQGGGAEDTITNASTIPIYKQSRLPGTTIVASYHGMAWYYENGSSRQYKLLEIGRIQSDHKNRFVVSNDFVEKDQRLRRSKSLDKLASKLFNTVLGK